MATNRCKRLWWEVMKSTYVLRRTTMALWTAVCILKGRAEASLAAIPISLRICSSLSGMETILVLVWEIIVGELVHHLGICSRLIIATHLVGSIAIAHTIPSIAKATAVLHHVHGGHVVHAHAHVSTKIAVHAVHHVEIWKASMLADKVYAA